MIESSYSAIPLTKKGRPSESSSRLPGWNEHVEPFRQDAIFWHSIWLSLNKPNSGHLYQTMCWSRNKYHYAIRKLKKHSDTILADQLLEASQEGDINLLKEMKKIRGGKSKSQTMPEEVDGKCEPEEILEKFKEVYENLYNSAETVATTRLIKEKLNSLIGQDSLDEVFKITGTIVKEACAKMKFYWRLLK